jgi:Trk K+ transport system NAD-binding subunit
MGWHVFRASLRDARLLLRDSGPWLLALVGVWLGFGLLIWRWYDEGQMSLSQALYIAFSQMTLNPIPPPQLLWLQILFYLAPAISFILIARGALNMGLLLFDKRNRREAWQMALASTYRDHVIVCGLGKIGFRVVHQLRATGAEVVVIESRSDGPFTDLILGEGVPVLTGDARQSELLQQAGIKYAQSVTVVTSDDLTNLDIALTARELCPDLHIVMRVFNDALAGKLASAFNIMTAFSTSALAAPTLAAAALGRNITNALYVAGKLLSTVELTVARDGILDGRLVQTIEDQHDVSVLYRRNRQGEDLRPRGDYRLAVGDIVVIIGQLPAISRIQELNQERAAPHTPIRS